MADGLLRSPENPLAVDETTVREGDAQGAVADLAHLPSATAFDILKHGCGRNPHPCFVQQCSIAPET